MRERFFPPIEGPAPLCAQTKRTVRFEECDPLSIMWHGRYPSYFEDAREALGQKYAISYSHFKEAGVALPIKIMHTDYCRPLSYAESCHIKIYLHWSDAARINMEYKIYNQKNELTTHAYTVQLMVSLAGSLMLDPPGFYQKFRASWQNGELKE